MIREAQPAELQMCLRMILSSATGPADDGQVVTFAQGAKARGIDPARMLVAAISNHVIWCVLPVVFPGRTAIYLSGTVSESQQPAARGAISTLLARHTEQGLRLAQVLLDPSESAARGFYETCGFAYLAELVYLEARAKDQELKTPAGFELVNYSAGLHGEFVTAIQASYRDTLDCPGLNGVRSVEDVIAGHKAAGAFSEGFWFLAREGGEPRGVLLLSPVPPSDAMELVYIGLAPEARRRGLSDALMRLAFQTAARAGCVRLTTAVDSKNTPALRMYLRHGMHRIGSRVAMMKVLSTPT
jgi:mycothiol synthase